MKAFSSSGFYFFIVIVVFLVSFGHSSVCEYTCLAGTTCTTASTYEGGCTSCTITGQRGVDPCAPQTFVETPGFTCTGGDGTYGSSVCCPSVACNVGVTCDQNVLSTQPGGCLTCDADGNRGFVVIIYL